MPSLSWSPRWSCTTRAGGAGTGLNCLSCWTVLLDCSGTCCWCPKGPSSTDGLSLLPAHGIGSGKPPILQYTAWLCPGSRCVKMWLNRMNRLWTSASPHSTRRSVVLSWDQLGPCDLVCGIRDDANMTHLRALWENLGLLGLGMFPQYKMQGHCTRQASRKCSWATGQHWGPDRLLRLARSHCCRTWLPEAGSRYHRLWGHCRVLQAKLGQAKSCISPRPGEAPSPVTLGLA